MRHWADIASHIEPGTLIEGKYRVEGQLGRGSMGSVFLAEDLSLQRQVALKFFGGSHNTAETDVFLDLA